MIRTRLFGTLAVAVLAAALGGLIGLSAGTFDGDSGDKPAAENNMDRPEKSGPDKSDAAPPADAPESGAKEGSQPGAQPGAQPGEKAAPPDAGGQQQPAEPDQGQGSDGELEEWGVAP
ncbi:hypothetical protein [Streptomyces boninensis]|uniref:hypothetical protein n=1 Tax=Streptomyces boninensis TaxID=2039455 RepID=UPI003B211A15